MIDLLASFPKLKKVIFSAPWLCNVVDERYGMGTWKLIVPNEAEVTISEELERYFEVIRK